MGERRERKETHAETRRREEDVTETGLSCSLSDWKTVPFGDICSRVQETVTPSQSGSRVYLGLEHLASGSPSLVGRGTEADVRSGKTAFRPNDVLFGKLRPYLRKSARVDESGVCSTDILVFRPNKDTDADYLCYLTHTREFIDHAMATTSGVNHPRTSWAALKEFKTLVPPLATQREIAAILGQVQKAIEEQERLLALTEELKRTLLHRLFTQGLRGEPQKQTEIGPVPESWDVVRLGELFQIMHGFAFLGKFFQSQGRYILLTPGHFFEEGGFREQGEKTKYYVGDFPQRYILSQNDLLVVMTEQKDGLLGSSLLVPKGDLYLHNQRLGLIHSLDESRLLKPFLYYLFNTPALRKRISMSASGSKVRHTSPGKICDILVALPPLARQGHSVEVLEALDNKRTAANKKHAALSDLFRTLLHQLMTGQITLNEANTTNLRAFASSREIDNAFSREAAKNAKGR